MIALLLDHLWQSSIFLGGAGLLALALGRNSANIRFWVWFAASAKFLVPFAILTALGATVLSPITPPLAPLMAMAPVAQPFSGPKPVLAMTNLIAIPVTPAAPSAPATLAATATTHLDPSSILLALWVLGFLAISARWLLRWRQLRRLLAGAAPSSFAAPIDVKFSASRIEPGLVGIFHPVILLPAGIEQQLAPAEMNAILAHELCHWRRRDNLLAAMHMLVEALFWFFPLVWWLGARLNAERERACDESVLAAGNDPRTYAEGILKVCRLYLQSPLVCAAGVSGAGLKKRMEVIMENRGTPPLGRAKKLLVGASAAAALAIPLAFGLLTAPPVLARVIPLAVSFPIATAEAPAPRSDASGAKKSDAAQPLKSGIASPGTETESKEKGWKGYGQLGPQLAAAIESQLTTELPPIGNLWPVKPVAPEYPNPGETQVAAVVPASASSNPISPAQLPFSSACPSVKEAVGAVPRISPGPPDDDLRVLKGTVTSVHTDPQLSGTDIVLGNREDREEWIGNSDVLVVLIPIGNVKDFPALDRYVGQKVCIFASRSSEPMAGRSNIVTLEITDPRQLQLLSTAAASASAVSDSVSPMDVLSTTGCHPIIGTVISVHPDPRDFATDVVLDHVSSFQRVVQPGVPTGIVIAFIQSGNEKAFPALATYVGQRIAFWTRPVTQPNQLELLSDALVDPKKSYCFLPVARRNIAFHEAFPQ